MVIKENSDFLFGFEALMTNPNGDPDQENKPRMDYETATALVSDVRRKRDTRDFLKLKGYHIFVDTLAEKKVTMEEMFNAIITDTLKKPDKIKQLREGNDTLNANWLLGNDEDKYYEKYIDLKKATKKKSQFTAFNNLFLTELIKNELIDIRLFGSAMAINNVTKTFTGPVQITWGYSLHPVELVKSNTITTIMNDDSSTFGKKHKLYYALIAHYGTINKFSAPKTGMTEDDRELFRKSLVQGMLNNQTDSKQGQLPLFYLEIIYKEDFDGYLGDLRRFVEVDYTEEKPIRKLTDLQVNFAKLTQTIEDMKEKDYIKQVVGWVHPCVDKTNLLNMPEYNDVDLWTSIPNLKTGE